MRAAWTIGVTALVIAHGQVASGPRSAALLAQVPGEGLSFVGIDLAKARGSAAMMAAVARLVRTSGMEDRADALRTASSLVIAGVPGAPSARMIAPGPVAPHGALAFGAIWLDAAGKRRLAQLLPDLGSIQWIAGTLETSRSGLTLAGSAALADPYVAARLAVSIGMGRKVFASQLPAPLAIAVDKIAITAMGATLMVSATWTDADARVLLDAW